MKVELIHNGFAQQLLIEKKPSLLKICDREENYANGFNTVVLKLDASPTSLLKWDESIEKAKKYKEKGAMLLWELNFHLTSSSFFDVTSLLTLEFAVEEFMKTIWSEFHSVSIGVIFFRGEINEYHKQSDNLKLLASRLSEEVVVFLVLDTKSLTNSADYFLQTRRDMFGHFIPILKGKWAEKYPYAFPSLSWNHGCSLYGFLSDTCYEALVNQTKLSFAIHLPEQLCINKLQSIVDFFSHKPFRLIPDSLLTHEWEGIDDLVVFSEEISERTKRKLLGFCAAGGRVVSEKLLGLPHEILLNDYKKQKKG